jgi:hypothetical protein
LSELSCVLRESGCPIQFAHLTRCRFFHLRVSPDASAVAIPIEHYSLLVVKHVAHSH